ncbi:hypothetical protein CFOL_v3_35606 [Cephalotus follicularis]|uniref:Protein FAR1-RELATED SEQUENCE n=1 Tax=Cephalotus follicularis TaxID=3775 RepID=A0A1Q3DIJ9_CEPFO|nr:hypothetical protein CFOL_v3_35606 [Cephalotus follicularis]
MRHAIVSNVYDSLTKEEFEERWNKLIMQYNLEDNAWLFLSWNVNYKRSESMNVFFDKYVNSKTTLKQFVEQYDSALRSKVEKENYADHQSFSSYIPYITHFEIEKQF